MNRIKQARLAAKLSQKYVALTLGIAAPSVSNWETGKTTPTVENLQQLSSLFGVSVDYLLGAEDATVPQADEQESEEEKTPLAERMKELLDLAEELDDDDMAMLRAYLAVKKRQKKWR